MVDFNKVYHNSDKFRQAALHFKKCGAFCLAPIGTSEYMEFWDEETRRCLEGYRAPDGDWISGYNYFYLNYCPIQRIVRKEITNSKGKKVIKRVKDLEFPDFYDYDSYFFNAVDEAEEEGKHMIVLKSRRKGYSFKCGSMLCRNYYLIPGSKSYAVAAEKEYLLKDGILTKAWEFMDFIDEHTAWAKKRQGANTQMHRRASIKVRDNLGNEKEVGYKSEIMGITMKNDPGKVRGKAGKLILFEEAGKNPHLIEAWQMARPSVEQDGIAYGLMIAFGTGGEEGANFEGLKKMFYRPEAYGCLPFDNIWDDGADGTKCGFFVPQYTNQDVTDDDGNRLYMDKDGNTLKQKALDYILSLRAPVIENAIDSRDVDRYIAEQCLTPAEACLEITGNIFPKKDLQDHLSRIRTNKKLQSHKQVGDLTWDGKGGLIWTQKKYGDITNFPLNKEDDPTGSIVIWEHPVKDPPIGLYIAGCLLPGEKVLTDKGLVNVEDVDFNCHLINRDGKEVKIHNLQRYKKVDEPVFELKPYGSCRTTKFTGEHPILLSNNTFVKASELKIGDELLLPNRYNIVKDDYKQIIQTELRIDPDNSDFWRFIGLWLGDGFNNINRNSHDIYMTFGKNQIDESNSYKELINRLFNRSTVWCKSNGGRTQRFTNKDLVLFLDKWFGKYALGKQIPEWVKYIPKENKLQLLYGYLDSDGSVYSDRNHVRVTFTSINLELLESIQSILYSIGICSSITVKSTEGKYLVNNKIQNRHTAYILKVTQQDVNKFTFTENCGYKYKIISSYSRNKNIKRSRRLSRISDCGNYIIVNIQNIIESKYTGTVYNFECDTHTYMCHDIVTHNCDPYDHDKSGTNSLGSTFIYKRFQNFEEYYELPVAEYTGRPETAEDYYENVRKLLVYYNARLLYENERKGIYPYFTNKHCDYLLADQPDILDDIVKNSNVKRRKGIHMSVQIKDYGEGLIKEWLNEEYAPGVKNLTKILSEPLLEELIAYNDKGNFDRVMAFMILMLYRLQLHNLHVKEKKDIERETRIFDKPLFTKNWFEDSDNTSNNNNIKTYIFS